jgi:hypothetical protein
LDDLDEDVSSQICEWMMIELCLRVKKSVSILTGVVDLLLAA